MPRDAVLVRLARRVQDLPLAPLGALEVPLLRREGPPPLILLAGPRSGSTLLYQTLVHALGAPYLSNLGNALHVLPLLGGTLTRRLGGGASDFRSQEGFVEGLLGPAEGLRFWSHWLGAGLDETVPVGAVDPDEAERRAQRLGRTLRTLGRPDAPFVTGYVGHVLVIPRLRALFPDAVYVRLLRDPVAQAASILRIRRRRGGWFSVRPRECAGAGAGDPTWETALQVHALRRRLLVEPDVGATVDVDYESLCADPVATVDRIVEFAHGRGLAPRRRRPLPGAFRAPAPVDAADARVLEAALAALEAREGPIA